MEDRSWLWQVEVALKDAERSKNALEPDSLREGGAGWSTIIAQPDTRSREA
jgi:hypothetical protein